MSFFSSYQSPLLRCKQNLLDIQDLRGLLRIHWQIGSRTLFSGLYTRVDQAILLWGVLTVAIFATAQFFPISWHMQAIVWSGLTLVAVVSMIFLTWYWAWVENLTWIIYTWAVLMLAGLLLTDLGIFLGVGQILLNLCPLWMGLSSIGYILTGLGLQSRIFILMAAVHGFGIAILPWTGGWQFLTTGIIMGGTLLLLSELQWDMRLPVESAALSIEDRQFNFDRQQERQLSNRQNRREKYQLS
jgi:hypothetical protein